MGNRTFALIVIAISIMVSSALAETRSDPGQNTGAQTSGQSADTYKWTDAQGIVHYGDAPADPSSQKYNIDAPAPASSANSASKPPAIPVTAPAQSDKAKTDAAEPAVDSIEKSCQTAKDNLAVLENQTQRIFTTGPDGQPKYLTPEDRQKQLDLSQRQITAYCEPEK